MNTSAESFFHATDYRELLKQRFQFFKSEHKKMSLQKIAGEIGIAKSHLKMILDKERHLSIEKLGKFAAVFKMDRNQKNYFYFLAIENIIKDAEMKKFFSNILKMTPSRHQISLPALEEQIENKVVFESSLHMIIKSLRKFPSFRMDASWVHEQLNDKTISMSDIQKVLSQFESSEANLDQFIQGGASSGESSFEIYKIGLGLASQVTENPSQYRPVQFDMLSLALDEASEKEAFEAFSSFRKKLIQLAEKSQSPKAIVFVSNNIFCVANEKA